MWLEDQLAKESSSENRHAVESALSRVRAPAPVGEARSTSVVHATALDRSPQSNKTSVPGVPSSRTPESKPEPRPTVAQVSAVGATAHPKALIDDALRVIQTELKRWDSEDGSELASLRRKATELDDSLKLRTQERDERATALDIMRDRCEQQQRSLDEATEKHNYTLRSAEVAETERHQLKLRATQLEALHSEAKKQNDQLKRDLERVKEDKRRDAKKQNDQLERDLERVKEDKRRDVEYTRDTERTAMAQELGKAASIHIENMKDLLQLEPSEKQRTALRSCLEELTRALRLPAPRLIG